MIEYIVDLQCRLLIRVYFPFQVAQLLQWPKPTFSIENLWPSEQIIVVLYNSNLFDIQYLFSSSTLFYDIFLFDMNFRKRCELSHGDYLFQIFSTYQLSYLFQPEVNNIYIYLEIAVEYQEIYGVIVFSNYYIFLVL